MGRSDGKLVRDIPAFERMIPQIMPRRCDSTNFAKVEFDLAKVRAFLRELRVAGHQVGMMDFVIAAYVRLLQRIPELNRFVVNRKLYQRNHICVAFSMLRRGEGTAVDETAVKVYLEQEDDLLQIAQKIRAVIKENEQPASRNAVDALVDRLMNLPLLPGFSVSVLRWMDRRGILPKSVIKLSPFHTSMYISNLASIQMDYVYHHLYEFGTAGMFVTMGKPKNNVMTLGISFDERICIGATWAKAFFEFKRSLENPERLLKELTD
ncbi:MAG: 2-oxo acid dehydrogenase subunit E2 [Oscillospiraceae bacterium]|nr:2-oxo acid dehydrogenase subunit E2 [Oscillospiraceae bacterium]